MSGTLTLFIFRQVMILPQALGLPGREVVRVVHLDLRIGWEGFRGGRSGPLEGGGAEVGVDHVAGEVGESKVSWAHRANLDAWKNTVKMKT